MNYGTFSTTLEQGKKWERPTADLAAPALFGAGAVAVQNADRATLDFTVVKNGRVVGFVEVKKRSITSTQYDTLPVHKDKRSAGEFSGRFFRVPAYVVMVYEDTVLALDLRLRPDEVRFLGTDARDGAGADHCYYAISRCRAFPELLEGIVAAVEQEEQNAHTGEPTEAPGNSGTEG